MVNLNVTILEFECFDFVGLHARCICCSVVFWTGWGDGLGIGGMVHLGKILKLNGQWVGDLEN